MKLVHQLLLHPSKPQLLVGVGTSPLRTLCMTHLSHEKSRGCALQRHTLPLLKNPLSSSTKKKREKKKKDLPKLEREISPAKQSGCSSTRSLSISSRVLVFRLRTDNTQKNPSHAPRILTAPPEQRIFLLVLVYPHLSSFYSFYVLQTMKRQPETRRQVSMSCHSTSQPGAPNGR